MVPATYNSSRQEEVKTLVYSEADSPVKFRNFIAWSFSEDFSVESYIDDGFYVQKVTSMRHRNFMGRKQRVEPFEWEYPYRAPRKFYRQVKVQ